MGFLVSQPEAFPSQTIFIRRSAYGGSQDLKTEPENIARFLFNSGIDCR
jgi:hypothetical protein